MSAQYDLVKQHLDYAEVLRRLGIPFVEDETDGTYKFRCINPQHNDADPSMRLRHTDRGDKNPVGAWRCWNGACSKWSGDVFDLIRVVRPRTKDFSGRRVPISLNAAVKWAAGGLQLDGAQMLRAMCAEDVRLQDQTPKEPVSMPSIQEPQPYATLTTYHPYFAGREPAVNPHWLGVEEARYCHEGPYEGYMEIPLRWIDGTTFSYQYIAVESWAPERRMSKGFKKAKGKMFPPACPINHVLYGCHRAMRSTPNLVLVEGIFDAWRVWDAADEVSFEGEPFSGVGTMTNRLSDEQEEIIRWLDPETITVLHDNKPKEGEAEDTAGINLALQVIERLGSTYQVRIGTLPVGHDPDSAGAAAITEAIKTAEDPVNWASRRARRLAGAPEPSAPSISDLL